jgi:hypothetical protein
MLALAKVLDNQGSFVSKAMIGDFRSLAATGNLDLLRLFEKHCS